MFLFGISSSQVLNTKKDDVDMNFAENWAGVFVVITFLTFGEAQIIGGIGSNLIAFTFYLGAIEYFAWVDERK